LTSISYFEAQRYSFYYSYMSVAW